jgi:uncharacterized protein DUF5681
MFRNQQGKVYMPKKAITNRQPSGRWTSGTSGNAAGRPVGSRNKSTIFLEELLSSDGAALVQKAKELALKGDTTALRLCLDRLYPPRKERTIDLELPSVADGHSFSLAMSAIIKAVGEGRITPGEARTLIGMLETQIRILEAEELSRRVGELEAVFGKLREITIRHSDPYSPTTQDETQPNARAWTDEKAS